ncbi:hypothetical protein [Parvibaculum sp.]|uniref:hypothetical protein n=1 Tax=Parvibaculum sp. TaxID=2024848 RepID=UPI00321018EA
MASVGRKKKLAGDVAATLAERPGPRHHDARARLQRLGIEIDAPDRAAIGDIKRAVRIGDSGRIAEARRKDGRRFGNAIAVCIAQGDDIALMHLRDEHDATARGRHLARPR